MRSNAWLTTLRIDPGRFGADREAVRNHLEADDIESRPVWKPMHLQPVFAEHRSFCTGTSEALFREGLCLPSGSAMTEADLHRVVDGIRSVPR